MGHLWAHLTDNKWISQTIFHELNTKRTLFSTSFTAIFEMKVFDVTQCRAKKKIIIATQMEKFHHRAEYGKGLNMSIN